jgi:hypothetical protein
MLDAGVHLSHKHTLLMKKHSRFKNSTKYSTESPSALTNGEETTDSIISKMLSNLSCLVSDRSSVMKKSNTLFNERSENIFKKNIPAFSVQGKSRSVSVLQKNMVTIVQNISES